MLKSTIQILERSQSESPWEVLKSALESEKGCVTLRAGLLEINKTTITVEKAVLDVADVTDLAVPPVASNRCSVNRDGFHVAVVVPTGVGATVGGFIGDAAPVVRALSAVADTVITHSNVVNASNFYGGDHKTLYVDGYTLDDFFLGRCTLEPWKPRIGLLLDQLSPAAESKLLNAANAVRAVAGANVIAYTTCRERIQANIARTQYGHFIGEVQNPRPLFEGALRLKQEGANCIAVVTDIGGLNGQYWHEHYLTGGVNPIGSIEALMSRAVTWATDMPCVHAPAEVSQEFAEGGLVDPRSAAEPASGSGLPCLLYGLSKVGGRGGSSGLQVTDLRAIIVPYGCCGGVPSLAALERDVPLIVVQQNDCHVGVKLEQAQIPQAILVKNYAEAIGLVACLKSGVSWATINRPLASIPIVSPH
jgi:hypothetical protein